VRVIGVDFESYYSQEYSLSKMTTEEYVRDPRFELIGVSVKTGYKKPAMWCSGTKAQIVAFLDKHINWTEDAVLCHNAAFDGAIMSWLLDRFPKLWIDTLSMARPKHLKTIGVSLAALANHYGFGQKGSAVLDAKGKRLADFTPQELASYGEYCCNDIELTYMLFKELAKSTPPLEMQVIDLTIRMFTEPKFRLNQVILEDYLAEVIAGKQKLIAAANQENRDAFMSNDAFAELLRAEGVDPPTKRNAKGKLIYAFAKTDKAMKALLEHESPRVQALAACRLGVKTTIEETRTASLLRIAKRGLFPIMLNYWGAGTGRFSGGGGVNPQNFRRGGKIKDSLEVAAGYAVIDSDLSQIEARVLALVAGQDDLVEDFRNKVDIYCNFATDVFGRPIVKGIDDLERFLGKTCVLGLGYYTGAVKLRETLRQGPSKDGVGGVTVTLEEAERIVKLYRQKYNKIPQFWRACGRALDHMVQGGRNSGYVSEEFNIRYEGHKVYLPNGAVLDYPGLSQYRSEETGDLEMRYLNRGRWTKIYSGLLCENIIQALARGVICEYLVTIGSKYTVALQVHDSIVCVVPQSVVAEAKAYIENVMSIPVSWLPGLPVACEAKSGPSYGAAR